MVLIVNTRPAAQAPSLTAALQAAGHIVRELPLLEISFDSAESAWSRFAAELKDSDAIVVTSQNAVLSAQQAGDIITDEVRRRWRATPTFVVGEATAEALRRLLGPEHPSQVVVPQRANVATLVEEFEAVLQSRQVHLLLGNTARREAFRTLPNCLDYTVYTVHPRAFDAQASSVLEELVREGNSPQKRLIVLSSADAASVFFDLLKTFQFNELQGNLSFACIGPRTAERARELGFSVSILCSTPSERELVEKINLYLNDQLAPI